MPIYMMYPGVQGTGRGKYQGWIVLQSAQLGVNRHVTSPSGRGTNREAPAPAVSEIVVTKDLDAASTNLYRQSLWGEGVTVTIDFVKEENLPCPAPYLSLELENTLISNYSVSGGGAAGQKPMESLSLNCVKITYSTVATCTSTDSKDLQDRAAWDLVTERGS
jgi:type VI secretion system secreted protein Hcp